MREGPGPGSAGEVGVGGSLPPEDRTEAAGAEATGQGSANRSRAPASPRDWENRRGLPRPDGAPPGNRDSQVGMCLPSAQPDFLPFREGAQRGCQTGSWRPPPPRGAFKMPLHRVK